MTKAIKKQALGRGLSALLKDPENDITSVEDKNADKVVGSIIELDINFIEINKIMLRPTFEWNDPNVWSKKLYQEGLKLHIQCISQNGIVRKNEYRLSSFVTPFSYDPIFNLQDSISIPESFTGGLPTDNEFPMKIEFELISEMKHSEFNVDLVIDAGLE